jgi:hypothetical protein
MLGEQGRDVAVRPHPEQQDVERRRGTITRRRMTGELVGVGGGRGLRGRRFAGSLAAGRHRVDVRRGQSGRRHQSVEERVARLRLVAVLVPGGQESLVPPPQVHAGPVDGVAQGAGGDLLESLDADRASGEDHVERSVDRLCVEQPGQESRGGRLREHGSVRVDHHEPRAHAPAPTVVIRSRPRLRTCP